MRRRLSARAKLLLFVFGLGSLYGGWYAGHYYARATFTPEIIQLYPEPQAPPQFTLTDHQGEQWGRERLTGGWNLLLPADPAHQAALEPLLYDLARLHNRLAQYPELHPRMGYLLLTPLPDNIRAPDARAAALRPLIAGYSAAFHALGGDEDTIRDLFRALDTGNQDNGGRFSWGGKLLLVSPQGEIIGELPRTFDPVALSEELYTLTSFRAP